MSAAAVAWLTFVWVLLWGSFTPLTIVGGVLVGIGVTALFRPQPFRDRLPVRPWRLLELAGFVAWDVVSSSVSVSREMLRYGAASRGAILELPLLSTSDRVVALIAASYTLSPGTLVLQIDHQGGLWYIYIVGPRDRNDVERARTRAMEVQCRVLTAVGAPEEIAEARRMMMGRT